MLVSANARGVHGVSIWIKDDVILVDGDDVVIDCVACPCDVPIPTCTLNDHTLLTDLYDTGFDDDHVALSVGDCGTPVNDPHYIIDDDSDSFVVDRFVNDDDECLNISHTCDATGIAFGSHTFRTSFTLPVEIDPDTFALLGEWGGDDAGLDILVNGVSTKNSGSDPFGMLGFLLARGFQAGTNEITFVWDQQDVDELYCFMRVKFTCIYTSLPNRDGFDWSHIHS